MEAGTLTLDVKILMFCNVVVIDIVVWRMKTFDGLVVVRCGQWRC